MNKFLLLIKVSRPIGWVLGPLFFLVGIKIGGANLNPFSILQLILLTFPYCLLLFGINDVYDYKSDKINPRKKNIQGVKLKPKYHRLVKNVSFLIIALLALSSLITLNFTNILTMALILFFSYFYSAPPIRLKEIPVVDSISNAILVFLLVFLGSNFGSGYMPLNAYLLSVCVAAVHAFFSMIDYESDKKVNVKTFATFFGKRITATMVFVVFLLTYIFANLSSVVISYYIAFCTLLSFATILSPEKLGKIASALIFLGFIVSTIIYLIL